MVQRLMALLFLHVLENHDLMTLVPNQAAILHQPSVDLVPIAMAAHSSKAILLYHDLVAVSVSICFYHLETLTLLHFLVFHVAT